MSRKLNKEPLTHVMAHVPLELRQKLVALSEASKMSLSQTIGTILANHMRRVGL
jgi:hypothetical protein